MDSKKEESFKQVPIYRAANAQQAQLLKNMLENEGIWAIVSGGNLPNATEAMGWAVEPNVLVREPDQESARTIALDFDKQISAKKEDEGKEIYGPSELDSELIDEIRREENWPKCPSCEKLRIAVCPSCEHAGTDFDAAEFIGVDDAGAIEGSDENQEIEIVPKDFKLMCSICDRAFEPLYMRDCRCGHQFKDGLETVQYESDNEFNSRVILIIAAIIAAIGVALLYVTAIMG